MWGQGSTSLFIVLKTGIIPTRVGTRVIWYCLVCLDKDHPHACGDKRNSLLRHRSNPGSSPRVWGQVFLQLPMILKPHIIPTRVGTSHRCRGRQCRTQDHPHACGDKLTQYLAVSQIAGSSPRVWGQVYEDGRFLSFDGIIPTRVGTRQLLVLR